MASRSVLATATATFTMFLRSIKGKQSANAVGTTAFRRNVASVFTCRAGHVQRVGDHELDGMKPPLKSRMHRS